MKTKNFLQKNNTKLYIYKQLVKLKKANTNNIVRYSIKQRLKQ